MASVMCPECGSTRRVRDPREGTVTCADCGATLDGGRPSSVGPSRRSGGRGTGGSTETSGAPTEQRWVHARMEATRLAATLDLPQGVTDEASDVVRRIRASGLLADAGFELVGAVALVVAAELRGVSLSKSRVRPESGASWEEVEAAVDDVRDALEDAP